MAARAATEAAIPSDAALPWYRPIHDECELFERAWEERAWEGEEQ